MPKPVKKAVAKKPNVAAKKPRSAPTTKSSSSIRKPSAPAIPNSPPRSIPATYRPVVTQEQIAVEAYYIAERRRKFHLPGDHKSDWLEAERRLKG